MTKDEFATAIKNITYDDTTNYEYSIGSDGLFCSIEEVNLQVEKTIRISRQIMKLHIKMAQRSGVIIQPLRLSLRLQVTVNGHIS